MHAQHVATPRRVAPVAWLRSFKCTDAASSLPPGSFLSSPSPLLQLHPALRHTARQWAVLRDAARLAPHAPASPAVQLPCTRQQLRRRQRRHVCAVASPGSGNASPAGSASFDSQDVAEELLGSPQRKGAASVTSDAAASLSVASQDGANSHGHDHQDGRQGHEHGHAPTIDNAVHRVLLWIYSHTGDALPRCTTSTSSLHAVYAPCSFCAALNCKCGF